MQAQKISLDGSKITPVVQSMIKISQAPDVWLTKKFDSIDMSSENLQKFQEVLGWVNDLVNKKEFLDALKEHDMSETFLCVSDYTGNFLDNLKEYQDQEKQAVSESQEILSVAPSF